MINRNEVGLLLSPDAKLNRTWFKEMARLLGVGAIYYKPLDSFYTNTTEIKGKQYVPMSVQVIYEEAPSQRTMKMCGWSNELQESVSIIHVPYDIDGLSKGSLFLMPSGLDNAKGRLFRVADISNISVYPASMTCAIVPEFESLFVEESQDHTFNSLNLLTKGDIEE